MAARDLSRNGSIFISRFEGWSPDLYNDLGNDAHIGFGHRLHEGPFTPADIAKWDTPIDKELGLKLLHADAQEVVRRINDKVDVVLRQGQFDALVSFGFNLGPYSIGLARVIFLLNEDKPQDARREILKYDHVGSTQFAGLTRRREAEAKLYRTGNYFLNQL